jgi:hypothetical protein
MGFEEEAEKDAGYAFHSFIHAPPSNKTKGFARRYFILYQDGRLCYSFGPGKPIRDELSMPQAALSSATRSKDIHVDTEKATFHIKCMNTEDFNAWMTALR